MNGRPYPRDPTDEEWACVAPYLSLPPQTATQRRHDLREMFNAVRYIVRTGALWRWLPEWSFAWVGRLLRLARDDERLPDTLDRSALRRLCLSLAP